MNLRNLALAIGLTVAFSAMGAQAGEQKRVLTEQEMAGVNAGIYIYVQLFTRQFFGSIADPLFGRQLNSSACPECGGTGGIEIGNGGNRFFTIAFPSFATEQ